MGERYFFFSNGHMARNQHELKFLGRNGQEEKNHEIRVIGTERPDAEDKDLITDYLYEVPRGWLSQFVEDGWQFLFYKKKSYFEAPSTSSGIYYAIMIPTGAIKRQNSVMQTRSCRLLGSTQGIRRAVTGKTAP